MKGEKEDSLTREPRYDQINNRFTTGRKREIGKGGQTCTVGRQNELDDMLE